jgi:hypothetical protein
MEGLLALVDGDEHAGARRSGASASIAIAAAIAAVVVDVAGLSSTFIRHGSSLRVCTDRVRLLHLCCRFRV